MTEKLTMMAVHAHPDDEASSTGGVLAVYAAQFSPHSVRAVYVAGGDEHGPFRERLHELLGIPVHAMDPFAGVQRPEIPSADRGGTSRPYPGGQA